MSRTPLTLAFQFLTISSLLSSVSPISVAGEDDALVKTQDPKVLGLKKEKFSHFRMYWHDIVDGSNPTVFTSAPPNSSFPYTRFGLIRMFDNPLTRGPKSSSKLLGRGQGFYASASQDDISLLMVENFAFVQGKYKGSYITLMGKNTIFNKVRELSVIGGSGHFRFARGYAEAKTYSFNLSVCDDAVVEYNIFVLHYSD